MIDLQITTPEDVRAHEWRKSLNRPYLAEWVEYLYNQIKPIVEEQHPEIKTI